VNHEQRSAADCGKPVLHHLHTTQHHDSRHQFTADRHQCWKYTDISVAVNENVNAVMSQ